MKRFTSLLLALACTVSLLSGCGGGKTPASSAPGSSSQPVVSTEVKDTLRVAMNRNMTTLNGINGTAQSFTPAYEVFDVLCALMPDMSLRANMATSWEQVDDYTWRFKLREGVKFHDGSDFTSEDAAYSINYIANMDPAYAIKGQWATSWPPEGVVVDEYTFDVVTPQPNLKVPELLNRCPMIPAGSVEADADFFKHPVGTGPYKYVNWEAGVSITLVANEEYWDGAPAVKNLIFYCVPDAEARMNGLKTGEYDYVVGVNYDVAQELAAEDGKYGMTLDVLESTGHSAIYYNYQSDNKLIQDVNFRKALQYAIDGQGIVDAILEGYATLARGLAPQNVDGCVDSGGFPARDIAKAQELAKACGYNGEEIRFCYASAQFTRDIEVCEIIVSQLQEAGFNATFSQCDDAVWDQIRNSGSWDIAVNNLGGTYTGDSELYYTQTLRKQYWTLEEADKLIASLYLPGITAEQREATLKECMQYCWDQAPFLWAVDQQLLCARSANLEGVEVVPLGLYRFTYAHFE